MAIDLSLAVLLLIGVLVKVFGGRKLVQAYLLAANAALAALFFHLGFPVSSVMFAISMLVAGYFLWRGEDNG